MLLEAGELPGGGAATRAGIKGGRQSIVGVGGVADRALLYDQAVTPVDVTGAPGAQRRQTPHRRPPSDSVFDSVQVGKGDVFVDLGDGDFDADFGHAEDVVVGENGCLPDLIGCATFHDGEPDRG